MQGKRTYGIKFPFTAYNLDGNVIDLNNTLEGKEVSDIMHVILTPKGSRLRKPDFGTDLIRFIFSENDSAQWSNVKNEIISAVSKWTTNTALNDIEVVMNPKNEHEIAVAVDFSVTHGSIIENKRAVVKI